MSTPDVIFGADLAAWFRAKDITGVADAAAVATWPDSSGNGRDATQASGSAQPTYHTGILNGGPIVRFDGVNDALTTALFTIGPTATVFAVARSAAAVSSASGVVSSDNSASGGLRIFQLRYDTAAGTFIGFDTSKVAYTDSQTATPTDWNILAGARDAASVQAFVGGTSDGSTAAAGTAISGSSKLYIGCTGESGTGLRDFLGGDIAEVIFVSRLATSTERAQTDSYLSDEHAITVSDYQSSSPMHHNGGVLSLHHNGGLITMHLPIASDQYPSYQTGY